LAAGFGILPNPLRGKSPLSKTKPCSRRVSGRMPETAAKMAALHEEAKAGWPLLKFPPIRSSRPHAGNLPSPCRDSGWRLPTTPASHQPAPGGKTTLSAEIGPPIPETVPTGTILRQISIHLKYQRIPSAHWLNCQSWRGFDFTATRQNSRALSAPGGSPRAPSSLQTTRSQTRMTAPHCVKDRVRQPDRPSN
jgi:hypothetical protein